MLVRRALTAAVLATLCGACGGTNGGRAAESADHVHTGGDAKPSRAPEAASAPIASARVFFFGHSLVGHDMPQMIGAFARARSKAYEVNGQVGWGTPLLSHWRWDGTFEGGFVPTGFPLELPNTLLFDQEAKAALRSGRYDAIVLTETNGFVSGSPGNWKAFCDKNIEFGGCSVEMAANLIRLARQHNAAVRPFIYTNWMPFADTGGTVESWVANIEGNQGWWEDLADQVEAQLAREGITGPPIRIIPVALVLARIVQQAERGELAALGLPNKAPLFSDEVHLTSLGFYIVALAQYAAIYRDNPLGLPGAVDVVSEDKRERIAGGFTVDAKLAAHFQHVVWEVLVEYPRSGVRD